MKDNKYYPCKNFVVLTYIIFIYVKKKWYTSQKQAKKIYNKLSNRPFTAITLKATNCFNIETHHM